MIDPLNDCRLTALRRGVDDTAGDPTGVRESPVRKGLGEMAGVDDVVTVEGVVHSPASP